MQMSKPGRGNQAWRNWNADSDVALFGGGMGIGACVGRYGVYAVHPSLKNMAYPGKETKEICENADIQIKVY